MSVYTLLKKDDKKEVSEEWKVLWLGKGSLLCLKKYFLLKKYFIVDYIERKKTKEALNYYKKIIPD